MIFFLQLLDFYVNFLNSSKQVIEFAFLLRAIDDYVF